VLWLETRSSHAVYEKEVHLIAFAPSKNLCVMRLAPTLLDRCPAGFAYLLTWLLLRGRRHARSHHYSKPCQDRKPNFSDRTHVGLPGFWTFRPNSGSHLVTITDFGRGSFPSPGHEARRCLPHAVALLRAGRQRPSRRRAAQHSFAIAVSLADPMMVTVMRRSLSWSNIQHSAARSAVTNSSFTRDIFD
jgi:hypothetical protein